MWLLFLFFLITILCVCVLLGPHLFGINLIQKLSPSLLLFTSSTFSTTTYFRSQRLHPAKRCFKGAFDFPGQNCFPAAAGQNAEFLLVPKKNSLLILLGLDNCYFQRQNRLLANSPRFIRAHLTFQDRTVLTAPGHHVWCEAEYVQYLKDQYLTFSVL